MSRRLAVLLSFAAALPIAARSNAGAPKIISGATDLGATASSRVVPLTVWLRMHDSAGLAATAQAMHDPGLASFQQFATPAAVASHHAPTTAEAAAVSQFLSGRGLTVTGVGANNLFVSAVGTAAQVQAALGVQLHDFQRGDHAFFANTSKPVLPASVQSLVRFVDGLTNHGAKPMNVRAHAFEGGAPPMALANPDGLFFSASCFRPPETVHFSSADASATYTGNRYGQDITNDAIGSLPPCGYQPSDIQKAFGLDKLYAAGLDGSGQTVAIVDAFGSTTIRQDAATFAAAMGLPPVDLTIIGTPTSSPFDADANKAGWAIETTLDVEWVHAIAPKAKILLVVAADNSFANLFGGILTAAATPGVVTISNSWEGVEIGTDPEFRAGADDLLAAIAAQGISVNFSSGDSGDEAINFGFSTVDWPASSPFATGIGGTSLSLKPNGKIDFQTAWGNNLTEIADLASLGSPPVDPPSTVGFNFGGGGGVSNVYPQPAFQRDLPFNRRAVPDISWLADPFTGVEIIFTADAAGDQAIEVIGGTSLACPMFSALWAIAAQSAGHKLGQAAALMYRLDGNAVTDIRPVGSQDNVTGVILDAGGEAPFSAGELAEPLQNLPTFLSAIYNSPFSTRWFVITFGTDSSLQVLNGYDTATGVGVPNPPNFVSQIKKLSR
jgi:subtilase family serine protease